MVRKTLNPIKQLPLLLLFTLFSCQTQKSQKVIKLAHGLNQGHSVHKAMVYMAQQLESKSKGGLTIQIYPAEQLGSESQTLEMLQIGSIGITKVSAVTMEGFIQEYKVLGLPYLFENKIHAFSVLDGGPGKQILQSGEKIWLHGLCFYDAGSRSFYTINKPVLKPVDLHGMKIRVMKSITAMDMVKVLGGSPTPISWGELYTALQSGVVDGAENNPPSFYLSRHYEICKYYSINEHTMVPDVVLISTHVWNKLTEQEQRWLQEAADESVIYQRKLWEASEQESMQKLIEAGVKVYYPDKAGFSELVVPTYKDILGNKKLFNLAMQIKNFPYSTDTLEIAK